MVRIIKAKPDRITNCKSIVCICEIDSVYVWVWLCVCVCGGGGGGGYWNLEK